MVSINCVGSREPVRANPNKVESYANKVILSRYAPSGTFGDKGIHRDETEVNVS